MNRRQTAVIAVALLSSAALIGCVTQPTSGAPQVNPALPYPDSLHWYRDAAEQKTIYLETYRAATTQARSLSQGHAARSWGVILDVDETILDNSDYQKRQAVKGASFDAKTWDVWISEGAATLLPGAKGFIDTVENDLHGQVVLITNRSGSQCQVTEENLRKVGIHYDRILCDSVGDGDKNGRFGTVIQGETGHPAVNVLIWVGDNIQDFPHLTQSAIGDPAAFGTRYFQLPNPVYGSWQKNSIR